MIRVDHMISWLGWKVLSVLFLLLFVVIFIRNAWVVDDAYITFRTVDNLINGHGLTWNVHERVQVYTHPMWMFLVSIVYGLFGNIFYSAIGLSFALCLASVVVAWIYLGRRGGWRISLLLLLMMASKAVMDYTSSGLENPLSYTLAILFFAEYLLRGVPAGQRSERSIFYLFLLASLAFFNRVDTLIVYLPALAHLLVANFPGRRWRLARPVLLATLPATLWELFSLFYYGFPFPNTAYAKVITAGFPYADKWDHGVDYLRCSISCDSLGFIVFLFALVLAVGRRSAPAVACLAGVLFYGLYTVGAAASATHMAGRFFALPIFVSFVAFAFLVESKKDLAFIVLLTIAFVLWNPVAPTKMGTKKYKYTKVSPSCVDTSWHVHMEGMAVKNFKKHLKPPFHDWMEDGKKFSRDKKHRIHLGGALGGEAIGYFGFAAGPHKIVVDYVGLGDPLLARLPPVYSHVVKSGHHYRFVPKGYLRSLGSLKNELEDPNLRTYYDRLNSLTRDDLFSFGRLWHIIQMNLGVYDPLIRKYIAGKEYRKAIKECSALKKKEWWHYVKKCLHYGGRLVK